MAKMNANCVALVENLNGIVFFVIGFVVGFVVGFVSD